MQHAHRRDPGTGGAGKPEAAAAASGAAPGRAAVGEDLTALARTASDAIGSGVVIILPGDIAPVTWPPGSVDAQTLATLERSAAALMDQRGEHERRADRRALLRTLENTPPPDPGWLLSQARRLGHDFSCGQIAVAAAMPAGEADWSTLDRLGMFAELPGGRIGGLLPLGGESELSVGTLLHQLAAAGVPHAASAPRRDPAALADTLREACVLLELQRDAMNGQEDTYRLLVGVLLRDPCELTELYERTVAELERYDALHDAELLATLEAFLHHHGSTTETADALGLHRHTVGYRLARVQEVAGLSPYESDGRERLGLGLKAHRIIAAEDRRARRSRAD